MNKKNDEKKPEQNEALPKDEKPAAENVEKEAQGARPENEQPPLNMGYNKATEWARSRPLSLRHLRQIVSAVYHNSTQFRARAISTRNDGVVLQQEILATAEDTASEYADSAAIIDAFYKRARRCIGDVRIFLVAEGRGWTTKMRVEVKEEDEDDVSLAK